MRTQILFGAGALALAAGVVHARPINFRFPRPADGQIVERTDGEGTWRATVWPTDAQGNDLDCEGWPQEKNLTKNAPATFRMTRELQKKGSNPPEFVDVIDVHQRLERIRNGPTDGEAVSDLHIEAIYRGQNDGAYGLGNVFGCLVERTGWYNEVRVPDLFGDTNGDGSVGPGDVLYSLVDLNAFLDSPTSYQLGDPFMVLNGTAFTMDGTPVTGMMFSHVPFTFTSEAGFTSPAMYTGPATADGEHGLSPVPTPGAISLLACGLGLVARRRR